MLAVGDPAPMFSGEDVVNGGTFALEEHQGELVLVAFNGITWCAPCQFEAPILQELWEEWEAAPPTPKVQFVMVSVNDSPGGLANAVEQFGLTMPVVYNPEVDAQWEVTGVPTVFVVGPDQTICAVKVGAGPPEDQLRAEIEQMLMECGAPVGPPKIDHGTWAAVATILFGVAEDGGGVVLVGGKPRPVGPWDPLKRLGRARREALIALAVSHLSSSFTKEETRSAIDDAAIRAFEAAAQSVVEGAKRAGAVGRRTSMPVK